MNWHQVSLSAVCFGVLVGCGSDSGAGEDSPVGDVAVEDVLAGDAAGSDAPDSAAPDATGEGETTDGPELPPRVCRTPAPWTAETPSFTNVTESSGLAALGVTGMRLSAADLDGDGLPELVVRGHAPGKRDDFGPEGTRYTWLLKNDGGLTFSDVTEASGLTAGREPGTQRTTQIVIFGDVDNDGLVDIFSGVNSADFNTDNGDRSEILLNNGDLTFRLMPLSDEIADLRREGLPTPIQAASFLDANLDGRLDLWVGHDVVGTDVYPDVLYRGLGGGGFVDATTDAGLVTLDWTTLGVVNSGAAHRRTWGTTVCDVDQDGWPDLLSSSYGRFFNGLWLSTGEGAYTDHAVPSGVAVDERTDWGTNLNAQCYCQLNPAADGCTGVPGPPDYFPCQPGQSLRWNHDTDRETFRLGGNTFGTICGDVDNDGDMDLMHLEIVHWDVGESSDPSELLYNQGDDPPTFVRPGPEATGLTRDWGRIDWNAGDINGALFDFDNDGRLDVYIGSSDYPGTRGFLFHQNAEGTFDEVPVDVGIDHPRSLGIAVADFDGDGDLDLIAAHSRARCSGDPTCYPSREVHVFRNDVGQDANWTQIELVGGKGSNRSAIGARIRVTAGGVTQTREIDGGHGHYGQQNGLVQTVGLGTACDIETIEVRWPDYPHTIEVFENVRANYRVRIVQGEGLTYPTAM